MPRRRFTLTRFVLQRFSSCLFASLLIAAALAPSGCTRSLRQEGTHVARAGSLAAKQMSEYYDTLATDTIRTWELTAFRDAQGEAAAGELPMAAAAGGGAAAAPAVGAAGGGAAAAAAAGATPAEINKKFYEAYQQRYRAFIARKQMASEIQRLYAGFASLADYNAAEDVRRSAGGLITALNGVLGAGLPVSIGGESKTPVEGILNDLISEVQNVQQSKAIRKESRRIVPILERLRKFLDTELVVYKSVPRLRFTQSTQLAKLLVTKKEVISADLVRDVLVGRELRFPEPQRPFTDNALIAGINGMIDARAKPLETASIDAADRLVDTFDALIGLHRQLETKKPLSFDEFVQSSATMQVLLGQLKEKGVSTDDLLEVLRKILEGK
jgi:hypothetical protein